MTCYLEVIIVSKCIHGTGKPVNVTTYISTGYISYIFYIPIQPHSLMRLINC
jgi:hypothetical protein